jgi:hypothetical protein
VENPRYDKRRKFGEDSFPVFKAGTRFLLSYHTDGKYAGLPKEALLVDRDIDNNQIVVSGGIMPKMFYASSREVTPRTIADLVAIHDVGRKAILDELLSAGRITVVDVDQACLVIRERQQKELSKKMKPKTAEPTETTTDTSTNTTPPPEA